jgi:hypothetical protein
VVQNPVKAISMRSVIRYFALSLVIGLSLQFAGCGAAVDVQSSRIDDFEPPRAGSGAGSATLSWLPPTANTDGTPLIDLAGYRVYRGSGPDRLSLERSIPSPGITTVVIDGLNSGTHYFAVTAYARTGAESAYSAVKSKTVP